MILSFNERRIMICLYKKSHGSYGIMSNTVIEHHTVKEHLRVMEFNKLVQHNRPRIWTRYSLTELGRKTYEDMEMNNAEFYNMIIEYNGNPGQPSNIAGSKAAKSWNYYK